MQMGWALSVFGWAYALFEIPGGWLGDRIGPRRVLMRIVLWWSFFTAATGWVWSPPSLIVTRALFGAGEAGAFPNMTRVLTTWLPAGERERAQAMPVAGDALSGAFTPLAGGAHDRLRLLAPHLRDLRRDRRGLGDLLLPLVSRRPERAPARSTRPSSRCCRRPGRPRSRRAACPGAHLLASRAVWLLSLQYMCLAYGWWFYINWLPTYLREARGTSLKMGALLAGLPLLLGGVGCLVSAALTPRLARTFGSVARARRIVAITGFVGASASIVVFTTIADPVQAMFVLGLAGFFNDFVMPAAWAGTHGRRRPLLRARCPAR